MTIHIRKETSRPRISVSALKRTAQEILDYIGETKSELSLSVVDNRKIRALNARFRGKDEPTDVLSFPLEETLPTGDKLLGDVVISLEQAEKQALEKGNSFSREVDWLLVHGILHLLGYDHERSRKDEKIMRSIESRLLRALSRSRS